MDEMDEIVQEFLVESHENLDQLDRDLVALEQSPDSRDLLSSVFRTIHTIKGTSGFLAYGQLEAVTHVGESLLSRLRDGELQLDPEITSGLLDMVDAVRGLLSSIEATGGEGTADHTALLERLTALQGGSAAAPVPCAAVPASSAPSTGPAAGTAPETAPASAPAAPAGTPRLGEVLLAQGLVEPEDIASAVLDQQIGGDPRRLGELLVAYGAVHPADIDLALQRQAEGAGPESAATVPPAAEPGAAPRISWRTPNSNRVASLRVLRREGACPAEPTTSFGGTLVAAPSPRRGRTQAVTDTAVRDPGRYCYAVVAVGKLRRPSRAATAVYDHRAAAAAAAAREAPQAAPPPAEDPLPPAPAPLPLLGDVSAVGGS